MDIRTNDDMVSYGCSHMLYHMNMCDSRENAHTCCILSIGVTLVKMNSECLSGDTLLPNTESLSECADACRDTTGCQYFIYGKGKDAKRCYWENTQDASCPEGFKTGTLVDLDMGSTLTHSHTCIFTLNYKIGNLLTCVPNADYYDFYQINPGKMHRFVWLLLLSLLSALRKYVPR